ncbi:replication protein [Paenibacillus graminis]|uniref:replication protein n=1 Tax=Paenibacillus graminis TaxID=189425 RepID=UPI002DB6DAB1|nr:replication protein [Paenibacillus graminis]MEC0170832.1 replication protein [Paenibacillus graminis]
MANPEPEDGYVKLANEIWNFSKRQKDIILFIWRLSYGCRKKTAIIPKLKDFEMCGIGYQNIRKELDHLSSSKVIVWTKDTNVFSVNKDYKQWQITPVKGWSEERFKELISVNLVERRNYTSQNEKLQVLQTLAAVRRNASLKTLLKTLLKTIVVV